jgi:hypothetical protein
VKYFQRNQHEKRSAVEKNFSIKVEKTNKRQKDQKTERTKIYICEIFSVFVAFPDMSFAGDVRWEEKKSYKITFYPIYTVKYRQRYEQQVWALKNFEFSVIFLNDEFLIFSQKLKTFLEYDKKIFSRK